MSAEPTLAIDGLEVTFDTDDGPLRAVDGVDLELGAGEIVALVGESGSGKSVTALSVLGLSRSRGTHFGGEIRYGGRNLLDLSENELRSVRGAEIAMVFQDPLTALNPVRKVGWQIEEMLLLHRPISSKEARRRAVELLAEVGIPDAESRAERYPHEFSGGMRQRAMIAMAMACEPRVLIADEPTTALDVTIQAQVLDLVRRLRDRHGTSVLLITHDLGIVAEIADRIAVMYAGRLMETAGRHELFAQPQHPYTWGLLASIPRIDRPRVERLRPIDGQPPRLVDPRPGCPFAPRCRHRFDQCDQRPPLTEHGRPGHLAACWLPETERVRLRSETLEPVS